MAGPTIHVGAEKFTAAMSGDVYHSTGDIFRRADSSVQDELFKSDGFLAQANQAYERMQYYATAHTDVNSGNMTAIYPLKRGDELSLTTGRMLDYCMAEPNIKQAWLDIDYEHIGYEPLNEEVGLADPLYRDVHDGEVVKVHNGYQVLEYPTPEGNPLSLYEQHTMIRNHAIIRNDIEDILSANDEAIVSVASVGTIITIDGDEYVKH